MFCHPGNSYAGISRAVSRANRSNQIRRLDKKLKDHHMGPQKVNVYWVRPMLRTRAAASKPSPRWGS